MYSEAAHSFRNGICLLSSWAFSYVLWQGEEGGSRSLSSVCAVKKESSVWRKEFNRSRKNVPSVLELTQYRLWPMVVPQQMLARWTKRRNEGTHKPCWWKEGKWMGHRAGPMATWACITDFNFLENYGLWLLWRFRWKGPNLTVRFLWGPSLAHIW